MLFQEMILLKQLIEGNRPPANGMEIHFLRCLKGDASPCSEKEKEWYQFWVNSKTKVALKVNQTKSANEQRASESAINQQKAQALLKQRWDDSNANSKPKKTKTKSGQHLARPPINEEDAIRKRDKLNRGIQLINKLNKQDHSRKKTKGGTSAVFTGGWTSLEQGEKKVGDTKAKQYITEGIAGTRDENKKMRGQLLGDMRKRGR